ncbi:glutaminase family protein [Dyadobacter psychrotolerans]|uniref:DUF4965 domain-containing protein n=1 Tax=Dyadobacter psychrotolerans TaxID=2541721 RepID=A0A4R5DU11_9BACT|nr:glutaminase family protein [Dyadobacter psychrotolerans]TDE15601.1 DUF4965 domain-containing protein [Dyadobacter psychrotolerans]
MSKSGLLILLIFATLTSFSQTFRPPATPLVTIDPYTSVWSFGDQLNGSPTRHWTGKVQPMDGLIRVDGKAYRFMGAATPVMKTLLPTAKQSGYSARFTTVDPGPAWYKDNYNVSSWKQAPAPFGTKDRNDAMLKSGTEFPKEVWYKREFTLTATDFEKPMLNIFHDDDVQVYINGVPAFECAPCFTGDYEFKPISAAARKALKKGKNILAAYCKNGVGPGYIDVGLADEIAPKGDDVILTAKQTGFDMKATQTIYDFEAGPIQLKVRFVAPLILKDLNMVSRPVNYVVYDLKAGDGKTHQVEILNSVSGLWAVNDANQKVIGKKGNENGLVTLSLGNNQQKLLDRKGDDVRIDWGYAYLSAPSAAVKSSGLGSPAELIRSFSKIGSVIANQTGATNGDTKSMAVVLSSQNVGSQTQSLHAMLGYDDGYSVQYFGQNLRPWWNRDGNKTIQGELKSAETDFAKILKDCEATDEMIYQDALKAGGKQYAELCVLAYRQAIAAHKLVADAAGTPLFLSKENFSNGSIGTVDITYPSAPLFLLYNPILLKGMMEPIFYYSESGKWTKPFAAHDVGTYPLANGQTYGEDMPVEESGNMLTLAYAVCKAENNVEFAKKHWKVLTIWANYLKKEGFDPANQLCTDDFAGHLARNANLSIKAIMGLASYAKMAEQLGETTEAAEVNALVKDFVKKWMELADSGDHYALTFDNKDSWSQKYNLVWDDLLKLNVFPKTVAEKEIKYYLTKQKAFGLPLDSRKTYSKSDWIIWTATLTTNRKDFEAFINPVYKFAMETPDRIPLSDWYETVDGKSVGFRARSVVGGYWMKVLGDRWK